MAKLLVEAAVKKVAVAPQAVPFQCWPVVRLVKNTSTLDKPLVLFKCVPASAAVPEILKLLATWLPVAGWLTATVGAVLSISKTLSGVVAGVESKSASSIADTR